MAEVPVSRIQGYLLANAEQIIDITKRNKPVDDNGEINLNPQPVVVKKAISDRQGLDNISDLFNAFENLNQVDFVTDLPDEVRVKLRPSIRVFKTVNTKDGKEIALELKSSVITGVENLINPGVVIKDIEIVRLGGNPEEVNTNITVKFRLYATKLGHYFDKQYPAPIKNFKGEIPDDLQKIVNKGISWLDLIKIDLDDQDTQDALTRVANADFRETIEQVKGDSPVTLEYDEPKQRIKLELSYGEIGDIEGYDEPTVQRLRQLVASQREVLFLSLVQNKIDFNDDGTAEIQIDYVASGGTNVLTREHDLLFDPYLYELELQLNDQIQYIKNGLTPTGGEDQRRELYDFISIDAETSRPDTIIATQGGHVLSSRQEESEQATVDESLIQAAIDSEGDFASEQIKIREEAIRRMKDAQAGLLYRGLYGPAMNIATKFEGIALTDKVRKIIQQEIRETPNSNKFSRVYQHLLRTRDVTGKISSSLSRFDGSTGNKARVNNYYYAVLNPERFISNSLKDSINFSDPEFINTAGIVSSEEEGADAVIDVQFVFLGDIIEVALEVLASNNRFGTDESFETKFFQMSNRIVSHSEKKDINAYERSYVRPFYFLPNTLAEAAQTAVTGFGLAPAGAAGVAGFLGAISAQRTQDKVLQRVYQEYGEILFSDIVYQNPANPNGEIKISLADLPICIAKYKTWLAEKIISKKRNVFYFRDFLSSLLNTLVRPILAERYSDGETRDREPPELIINRLNVDIPFDNFLENILPPDDNASNAKSVSSIKFLIGQQSVQNDSLNAKPLTVISQTPVIDKPVEDPRSRRLIDRDNNVPHILFGDATNGILQDLSFQRIDMPGLREARLFEGERLYNEDNYSGPNIYREKYNASVSLVGTTFFKPGTQFYLDPVPLDLGYAKEFASPARLLGLGGYYLVVRATHQINLAGSATWETSLDTQWQSFGDDSGLRTNSVKQEQFSPTSLRTRLGAAIDLNDPSKRRQYLESAFRQAVGEAAPDVPTQAASTGVDDGNEVVIGRSQSGEEVELRRRFPDDVRRALGLKD
jgi:hypothetical protein